MRINTYGSALAPNDMARLEPRYLRFDRSKDASGTPEPVLYWRSIVRARWLILASGLTGAVFAAFIAHGITPVYQATALLLVSNEKTSILSIDDSQNESLGGETHYMTQYEYLLSYNLGLQVIKSLVLWQQPGFAEKLKPGFKERLKQRIGLSPRDASAQTPDELAEASWPAFSSSLAITTIPDSRLISVRFESTDPDLAATVANRVARTYLDAAYSTRMALYGQIRSQLDGQEAQLLGKLQDSQSSLQQFRERNDMLSLGNSPTDVTPLPDSREREGKSKDRRKTQSTVRQENPTETMAAMRIAGLTVRLAQARQRRIEIESIWQQASQASPADYDKLPGVTDTPGFIQARQQLDAAAIKLAELGQRYGHEHPRIREALAERTSAEERLIRQAQIAVASLAHELGNAKAAERVLGDEMAAARGTVRQLNRGEAALGSLERDQRSDRQRYDLTRIRNNELSALQQLRVDPARIIQTAMPEIEPVRPDPGAIILSGLLAGLILTSLGAILRDRFWLGVRTAGDAERLFAMPVLIEIPPTSLRSSTSYLHEPVYEGFPEAIRILRSAILLSDVDRPQRSLLITSSVAGEGKSTISANLAFSLAQTGSCLLIDADLRRAGLSLSLDMPRNQCGLTDYLTLALNTPDAARPEDFIHRYPGSVLDVMPSGAITEHPLELIQSAHFKSLLENLGKHYQSIVIDSPPLAPVSDALVIAPLCTRTLHILRSGSTQYPLTRRTLLQLRRGGAQLLGIVLNTGVPVPRFHLALPAFVLQCLQSLRGLDPGDLAEAKGDHGKDPEPGPPADAPLSGLTDAEVLPGADKHHAVRGLCSCQQKREQHMRRRPAPQQSRRLEIRRGPRFIAPAPADKRGRARNCRQLRRSHRPRRAS